MQLSAGVSDLGTALIVTFDIDTDYGATVNLGGSFECLLLLDYPGVNELDVCTWTSGAWCCEGRFLSHTFNIVFASGKKVYRFVVSELGNYT